MPGTVALAVDSGLRGSVGAGQRFLNWIRLPLAVLMGFALVALAILASRPRYELRTVGRYVLRMDTRTGHVETCALTSAGGSVGVECGWEDAR